MANYNEVKAACEQLQQSGQPITLERLIKQIGGSRTSIMVHFDQWCSKNNYQPPADHEDKAAKGGLGLSALSSLSEKVPGSLSKLLQLGKRQQVEKDQPELHSAADSTTANNTESNAEDPQLQQALHELAAEEQTPTFAEATAAVTETPEDTADEPETVSLSNTATEPAAMVAAEAAPTIAAAPQPITELNTEQLAEHEQQYAELQQQLNQLRQQIQEQNADNSDLHQQFTDAQKLATQRQKALNELQQNLNQHQADISELKQQLHQLEQQKTTAHEAARAATEQLEILTQKFDSLQLAYNELHSSSSSKQSEHVTQLEQRLEQMQQELSQQKQQVALLEQQLQKAEQAYDNQQKKLQQEQEDAAKQLTAFNQAQAQLADQEQQLVKLQQAQEHYLAQLKEAKEVIEEQAEQIANQTRQLESLTAQLPEMRSEHEFAAQEQELQRLRAQLQVFESKLAHLRDANVMLKEQSEVTAANMTRQRETIKLQREETNQLREAQQQALLEKTQLQQHVLKLEEQLTFVKDNSSSTIERLTFSNKQAQLKIAALEQQLKNAGVEA